MTNNNLQQQRGGTFLGFIIGVVVGLAAALAVAVYVTKVPLPFMNKGQSRSAEQDAEEARKNKNWDPNAPLYGKNPVAKPAHPTASEAAAPAPSIPAPVAPSIPAPVAPSIPAPVQPPVSNAHAPIPAPAEAKADSKKAETKAASPDPIADMLKSKSTAAQAESFTYWVQVGAYSTLQDAETQRAKLSLAGIVSKVSERELSGNMVYRVRVGPFDKKEEGEKTKETLEKSGLDTALVRVQR